MGPGFLLPLGLAVTMLAVGLSLRVGDFRRLIERPKAVGVGLACQMLVLPLLALGLVRLVSLPDPLAIGIVLLACAPGGVTASLITRLAGADVALSLTVTGCSTLACVATLPMILALALPVPLEGARSFPMPVDLLLQGLLVTVALPVGIGMALRAGLPRFAGRIAPTIDRVALVVFGAVVALTFFEAGEVFRAHGAGLLPLLAALNLAALLGSFALARLAGLPPPQRRAIAIECGLQNAALAIVLAHGVLDMPSAAVPAVLYAAVMNASALAIIALARRIRPDRDPCPVPFREV